ncbi:MAG: extracellular solute-binding protein [Oscillospiraceae bacterium]|nr:extracellular solute-binding protein [Oscillospiraceae bacterium]
MTRTKNHSKSKKLIIIILASLLLLQLTACSSEPDIGENETPDTIFVPEFTDLTQLYEGLYFTGSAVIINETVYFSAIMQDSIDEQFTAHRLFSANLDGTNLIELQSFTTTTPPANAEDGTTRILAMATDSESNLWIVESAEFFIYNFPEYFTPDPDDSYATLEYREILSSNVLVRKLDNTGATLETIEINEMITDHGLIWIRSFVIDKENIYFATNEKIAVYNYLGNQLYTIDVDGMINSLIYMTDGNIAVNFWGSNGGTLQIIDKQRRELGEILESMQFLYVFSGDENFLYYISDQTYLYGLKTETDELVQILNLVDSSIVAMNLMIVSVIDDDQVLMINRGWDNFNDRQIIELISLNRIAIEDHEVTTITFATFFLSSETREAIIDFNRRNSRYHIQVTDYSEFATDDDYMAGVIKLNTEIVTGNIPDMLDIMGLPVEQYVAMGLLENLYSFIDNDTEINREDFVENIFTRAEINNDLYYIFPFFTVSTIIGNPNILGNELGWNMDEFLTVLQNNPDADIPLGAWFTNRIFLNFAIENNIDFFVDRDAGLVNFDNEDFIELLEIANMFPSDVHDTGNFDERDDIATGRQIMAYYHYQGFIQHQMFSEIFGGELVIKGFPNENRNGNTINPFPTFAITSTSENKEGAWSFISHLMSEYWQRTMMNQGQNNIPTNKAVFEWMIENAMNQPEQTISVGTNFGGETSIIDIVISPLTQTEREQFIEFVNSANVLMSSGDIFTSLMDIVIETASGYFLGQITAENAARVIQSRASILVSEQFG